MLKYLWIHLLGVDFFLFWCLTLPLYSKWLWIHLVSVILSPLFYELISCCFTLDLKSWFLTSCQFLTFFCSKILMWEFFVCVIYFDFSITIAEVWICHLLWNWNFNNIKKGNFDSESKLVYIIKVSSLKTIY